MLTCGRSGKGSYHSSEGVNLPFGPFRAAERYWPQVPWVPPTATHGLPLRGTSAFTAHNNAREQWADV